MFALLLFLSAALQDRPVLLEVRTLTDGHARSGCWLPLKARVGGAAGTEGELTATADGGFPVTRPFRIPAGGSADVIVPVVVLARDAKVEVILRVGGAEIARRRLSGELKFLDRQFLVLIDPKHPESDSLVTTTIAGRNGRPLVFATSDPADWNEAADMGAFESVDGVIPSSERLQELTMTTWRALGGAVTAEPRRDLLEKLGDDPVTRFESLDAKVARFTVEESWIPRKRNATMLFAVVYGFGFFVAVFLTWSRKGGPYLLTLAAVGIAGAFVASYLAFFPKGNVAVRSWQVLVEAPEAPMAVSVSAVWGSGPPKEVEFGRWVKPVFPQRRDVDASTLEMRRVENRWIARGVVPGSRVRFVSAERLGGLDPYRPYLDAKGESFKYKPDETDYYRCIDRKYLIRLQDPGTAVLPPVKTSGLVESSVSRLFRLELKP